jgi:uncharacterized repeat protein (TIGR01451 family)
MVHVLSIANYLTNETYEGKIRPVIIIMKKLTCFILILLIALKAFICPELARGQYQYNSPEKKEKSMFVDKQVRAFGMDKFYDNLDGNQKKFIVGDMVEFIVKVENNGLTELNNIVITDYLPKNLEVLFTDGTYNSTERTVVWKKDLMIVNEKKEYYFRAKIVNDDVNSGVYTNVVKGVASTVEDQDTSSYVLGKGGSVIPKTGASNLMIGTIFSLSSIGGAIALRKKIRGY